MSGGPFGVGALEKELHEARGGPADGDLIATSAPPLPHIYMSVCSHDPDSVGPERIIRVGGTYGPVQGMPLHHYALCERGHYHHEEIYPTSTGA